MALFDSTLLALCCFATACDVASPDGGADTDTGSWPTGPLTCADVDRGAAGQELVYDAETTLSGVYRIADRAIYDDGQVVTIEAGTVFFAA